MSAQHNTPPPVLLVSSRTPACASAPGAGLCTTDAAQLIGRREGRREEEGGDTPTLANAAEYNGRRCPAPDLSVNLTKM